MSGIGRAAKAAADVLKVAISSTAATVRLIMIALALATIFLGTLWVAHHQGWTDETAGLLRVPGKILRPIAEQSATVRR